MPPQPLFDVSSIDPTNLLVSKEEIYQVNPHRFEFMQLDGIVYIDESQAQLAGIRYVRDDEFWVRGHIPGRPILPGVLMIETAAQLVSYFEARGAGDKGFLGFGGVTDVKFRGAVTPGDTVLMLGKLIERRPRRCLGSTQAYVNGKLVYEGVITGMWL